MTYGLFRRNLAILLLLTGLIRSPTVGELVNQSQRCDNSSHSIAVESNTTYTFVGCDWTPSSLPTLTYKSSLSNVTINVVNCNGLPTLRALSWSCAEGHRGHLQYVIESTHTPHASPQAITGNLIQIKDDCVKSFSFHAHNSVLSFDVFSTDGDFYGIFHVNRFLSLLMLNR